jgi:hypothetical protein
MKLRIAALPSLVLIASALSLICPATKASAQATGTISIPFEFMANHQLVPAGSYKVDLLSDRFLALIDGKTGTTRTVLLVRPEEGPNVSARTGFVLHSVGGRYSLKEVKIAGSSMRSELAVQPKPEPVMAKGGALKNSTIEIAIK